jgi:hypothetical protein
MCRPVFRTRTKNQQPMPYNRNPSSPLGDKLPRLRNISDGIVSSHAKLAFLAECNERATLVARAVAHPKAKIVRALRPRRP